MTLLVIVKVGLVYVHGYKKHSVKMMIVLTKRGLTLDDLSIAVASLYHWVRFPCVILIFYKCIFSACVCVCVCVCARERERDNFALLFHMVFLVL